MIKTTSARVAITIATGNGWSADDTMDMIKLGVRVQKGSAASNIPSMLHGLDCGRILAAIDRIDEPARDWAVLVYGAAGYADSGCVFRVHDRLYAAYVVAQGRKPQSPDRIRDIAMVAMHDMRHRLVNHVSLKPADYAQKAGFDVRNWGSYKDKIECMHKIMDGWDKQALGVVSRALDKIAA